MKDIDKGELVAQICAHLESAVATLRASAQAAAEAATHAESKPENKYDTRGLEASYLAGAQKARLGETESALAAMRAFQVRCFLDDMPIGSSALVELDLDGARSWCFLAPHGAGLSLVAGGTTVAVVTPSSPLGSALLGKGPGDVVTVGRGPLEKEYEIARVW